MRIQNRGRLLFGLVMFMGLSILSFAADRTPEVVGKIVRSSNATLDGGALLTNSTIFSGDAVKVEENGVVLLRYSPTGRAALTGLSSARFTSTKGKVEAQLLLGTLAVERQNNDTFVVKTSTYQIAPIDSGRAEFVVGLLPDKRAMVETQHGRVVITETRSGESYTLAEGLVAQIPAPTPVSPAPAADQHKVIGRVVSSVGATQNGKPLSGSEWIHEGDSIATATGGSAVIQLLPTNQVTLDQNTFALFTLPVDRAWIQLQNGALTIENKSESSVLIATTRYRIESNAKGPSKISVGIKNDDSTSIEAITGDVKIREIPFEQAYLLPAGHTTIIPANATGIAGLQPVPGTAAQTPSPQTTTGHPQAPPKGEKKSHTTIIIVGVAAGGGIAGAIAALGGHGGGGSPPISPSAP